MLVQSVEKGVKNKKSSRRQTCAASCSINTLRYLLCARHSTSMWLPLLRQRGHDIRPRTERCYPKTIRRIVFGWKRGESGEKHRTRLCRSDCVCPSRACRFFRHAQPAYIVCWSYQLSSFKFAKATRTASTTKAENVQSRLVIAFSTSSITSFGKRIDFVVV